MRTYGSVQICREFAQTHENARHLSDAEWSRQFIEWFKDRVTQLHKGDDSCFMEDLLSVIRGPTKYSTHSNVYIANGYRFHVEEYDKKLRTQNCGVVVLGEYDEDSENLDYYGMLTNIIELQFVMDRRVVLFRCNWFDVYDEIKGVKKDEFKMKPLKTENEVDSNMKSTIRYTFVAPGAIGKGWGRGLKSLGEKGNTPSKSLLPQSSDLVKKCIKEIETRGGVKFQPFPTKMTEPIDF
ncbi:hypothetical protein RDI58_007202 [Solanum bulbocastanum]|uniref:DUF4216 domain-containing protein n=1 Tax=Solanum bulbocastanum TaxID=147425 RepID=A0AAN8YHH5_SOLBU